MERTIFLIRHGRPDLPDRRMRFLGSTDLPLSFEGINQAKELKKIFQNHPVEKVFHSGMKRTAQTAEIIFGEMPVEMEILPDLREITFGDWENLAMEEISSEQPQAFAARGLDFAGFRPPGGESFLDLRKRVYPAFEKILDTTRGDVVIVGHAGVFKSIIITMLGLSFQKLFSFSLDYCGVTMMCQKEGFLSLKKLNWTPHIQEIGQRKGSSGLKFLDQTTGGLDIE